MILGPFARSSPSGASFRVTLGRGRPTVPAFRAFRRLQARIGLASVIP